MSPALQSLLTNAELTLLPLVITALGLWLRLKIATLQAKAQENSARLDVHDDQSGIPSKQIVAPPDGQSTPIHPMPSTEQSKIKTTKLSP